MHRDNPSKSIHRKNNNKQTERNGNHSRASLHLFEALIIIIVVCRHENYPLIKIMFKKMCCCYFQIDKRSALERHNTKRRNCRKENKNKILQNT